MIFRWTPCSILAVAVAICITAAHPSVASVPQVLSLDGPWRATQPDRGIDIPATVPGVIDQDLIAAGKIPNPYYGDNLRSIQWVATVPWTYSRSFKLPSSFLSNKNVLLRCEGLDTLAKLTVNGRTLASTDNMFRTWEFDVKSYLHPGLNTISVTFQPIEPYLESHVNQVAFPNKTVDVHGWGYIRKAPYQPGWDFAPDLVTCGIWRSIRLIGWTDARLTDIGVVQNHLPSGVVRLDVTATADTAATVEATETVSLAGRIVAKGSCPVKSGAGTVSLLLSKPQLWWPAGMGKQPLYRVDTTLRTHDGAVVDSASRWIGLRTITWLPKTATRPLTLAVNGVPFFAKGSNWVPSDAIMTRTTPAQLSHMVDMAVAANMNFMRLWGGGFYEDNALYDACDRKGLLVWSEFKFADSAYPAFDPQWLANVRSEVDDNVRRLRLHPSIAVWSGNNEVIGFVRDTTSSGAMSKQDYDLLFHQTIPEAIRAIDPTTVYTPGSPESGDQHDWDVWHGDSGYESYRSVHGFMSEFGFQAFPQPLSVDQFTSPQDRTTVLSPVMEFHQHNWRDGNLLIMTMAKRYYNEPKDFDSALWLSQISQADGILTGIESWRRDWPNSTGSLVWQFDDPWPAISWSMIDYYGRPKALYYRVAHAYAPVMLSSIADPTTNAVQFWVSNDRPRQLKGKLAWQLFRTDGSLVSSGVIDVDIPKGTSSAKIDDLDEQAAVDQYGPGDLLMSAHLTVQGEPVSRTLTTFARPKEIDLADPAIHTNVQAKAGSYVVTLAATRPALDAWVELNNTDANYSDNFVTLVPGDRVSIVVTPKIPLSLSAFRAALSIHSLYDTYQQSPVSTKTNYLGADGTVTLRAEDADIVGDNVAHLEFSNPADIGNWQDVNDSLHWWVKSVPAGEYSVTVNLSCPPGDDGSTFTVRIGHDQLMGIVPATSGWTDYHEITLGKIVVSKATPTQIELQPTHKASVHVMNLRSITLKPVNSAGEN